jgi:hypothetical protein
MGSKEKVWLEGPAGSSYLFKYVRQDSAGRVYGDDWAEKLAAGFARLLDVPAARVHLADRAGHPGVISRRVNDPGAEELVHGNELLGGRDAGYDKTLKREHPLYTVAAVHECLRDAEAPRGPHGVRDLSGFAVWAGYLVFDAWIANTDRHHENWAVLIDRQDGSRRLAPSFDHGSSLGFNRPISVAAQVNGMDAIERWCRRGRSSHFAGRPKLVDVAADALELAGRTARRHWMSRLRALGSDDWNPIVDRIPDSRMSEDARTFVSRVLDFNRGRLLDVCDRAA